MTKRSLLGVIAGGRPDGGVPCCMHRLSSRIRRQPGNYPMPEGSAKTLVQEKCVVCHDLRNIVNSNKSAEDWDNTVNMMAVGRRADQRRTRPSRSRPTSSRSFPEKPRPQPAKIGGPVKVKFTQWNTPTPGSRPHDPLATPDGAIVVVADNSPTVLGRLDPKTGEMKEYPDPGRGWPAWPDRRQGRKHLVRRQLGRSHRQARCEDRRIQNLPDARPEGARPAHAAVRQGR